MTLELELPPEIEARLRDAAAREGVDVSQFATNLIEQHLPTPAPDSLATMTSEEWTQRFLEWVETHSHWPQLPPEAYERASFYEDPDSGLPRGY